MRVFSVATMSHGKIVYHTCLSTTVTSIGPFKNSAGYFEMFMLQLTAYEVGAKTVRIYNWVFILWCNFCVAYIWDKLCEGSGLIPLFPDPGSESRSASPNHRIETPFFDRKFGILETNSTVVATE